MQQVFYPLVFYPTAKRGILNNAPGHRPEFSNQQNNRICDANLFGTKISFLSGISTTWSERTRLLTEAGIHQNVLTRPQLDGGGAILEILNPPPGSG
jgi:hypothetical protein